MKFILCDKFKNVEKFSISFFDHWDLNFEYKKSQVRHARGGITADKNSVSNHDYGSERSRSLALLVHCSRRR